MDLSSNGSAITKGYVDNYDKKYEVLKEIEKEKKEIEEVAEVEEKQITFDDFTKDFKI